MERPVYLRNMAIALVAMLYSTYAIWASGLEAVMGGVLVMAIGYIIWGLIAARFTAGTTAATGIAGTAGMTAAPTATGIAAATTDITTTIAGITDRRHKPTTAARIIGRVMQHGGVAHTFRPTTAPM